MLVCCFLFGHFDGNAETNDAVKEGLMLVPFPKSVIKCSSQQGDRQGFPDKAFPHLS
jgi:hypothetical protein